MMFNKFISHRGANTYAPENTIDAFDAAYESQLLWVEIDAQLSFDNHVVIFHDYSLNRLCNVDKNITDIMLKEIKETSLFGLNRDGSTAFIPTLREYFIWMSDKSDVYTNIELKEKPVSDRKYEQRLAKEVITLLKEFPELKNRVVLSSFNQLILNEIRTLDASLFIAMLLFFPKSTLWEECFLEFRKNGYSDFQRLNCCAIGINIDNLTKERVHLLKDLCFRVLGYANKKIDKQSADAILSLGVDSIFIDEA